ncbi:peptidoglycan-binding domain-containing protein [Paenochrobactrum glaciei]|uniref:peptidoglycan-binding domain-containing protein n=1 Tax=Paenochrobactrum glaciei TaxID=486407 RepID=UPI0031E35AAD
MSGRKTSPVKRNNRRNERSRNLSERFVGFLLTTIASGAVFTGRFMVRNPVLTGGATAFLVVMGFVSANALWYQPQSHDNLFFRTRPEQVFVPTPKPSLLSQNATNNDKNAASKPETAETQPAGETSQATSNQVASLDSIELTDELPALAPNADVEIAKIQQKLLSLGLYDGAVDGLPGPKTRQAVEQWQQLQQKAGVNTAAKPAPPVHNQAHNQADSQASIENIIQVAVPEARPQPQNIIAVDKVVTSNTPPKREVAEQAVVKPNERTRPETVTASLTTNSQPVTSQDIVRVQAGLKAFGNDLIIVDGVAGQSTQDAIREFQKLFDMQITGQVDMQLIGKMREIGLIS